MDEAACDVWDIAAARIADGFDETPASVNGAERPARGSIARGSIARGWIARGLIDCASLVIVRVACSSGSKSSRRVGAREGACAGEDFGPSEPEPVSGDLPIGAADGLGQTCFSGER